MEHVFANSSNFLSNPSEHRLFRSCQVAVGKKLHNPAVQRARGTFHICTTRATSACGELIDPRNPRFPSLFISPRVDILFLSILRAAEPSPLCTKLWSFHHWLVAHNQHLLTEATQLAGAINHFFVVDVVSLFPGEPPLAQLVESTDVLARS